MFHDDLIASQQTSQTPRTPTVTPALSKGFVDPCHANRSLYYAPIACAVIDTPEFQRLRRLKQLGTSHTVFPGGVHTRFQHSLGVYFFAKQLMRKIRDRQPELLLTSRDVENVALAGLCHDLGHGPFSHAFEGFTRLAGVPFEHEEMSAKLVARIVKAKDLVRSEDDDELQRFNDPDCREEPPVLSHFDVLLIRCMISTADRTKHEALWRNQLPKEKEFMMDVVCNARNSIDVDKFDYLIRDAYFCGTAARPTPHRLIDNCKVIDGQLCYAKKVLPTIYQLFTIRANNFREVYGHPVAKAIEFMIMDALMLVDDELKISKAATDPAQFIKLDDDIVSVVRWMAGLPMYQSNPKFQAAVEILERIERRQVYKTVFETLYRDHAATAKHQKIDINQMKHHVSKIASEFAGITIKPNELRIQAMKLNFAMGDQNPLQLVRIYDRDTSESRTPTESDVGHMIPKTNMEFLVRVFCSRPDAADVKSALRRAARSYLTSMSTQTTPAATPTKHRQKTTSRSSTNTHGAALAQHLQREKRKRADDTSNQDTKRTKNN